MQQEIWKKRLEWEMNQFSLYNKQLMTAAIENTWRISDFAQKSLLENDDLYWGKGLGILTW